MQQTGFDKLKHSVAPFVVLAALFAGAAPAVAQSADEKLEGNAGSVGAQSRLEEIVVTAERRETRLQETPIAITAFSADALTVRGIRNIYELQTATPNLSIVQSSQFGGSSTLQAYIRGVGAADYLFPADPGVGYYLDGVYVARTLGGLQAITDVERVEILKGPQGTLFGRNTIGGAISVTTTQPQLSGPASGDLEIRAGSFDRLDVLASLNMPLSDGVAGAKLSAARISADGYGKQLTTDVELGEEDKWVVRGALRFAFAEAWDVTLTADYSTAKENGPADGLMRMYPSALGIIEGLYNPFIAPALNPSLGLPDGTVFDTRFLTGSLRSNYSTAPSYDEYDVGGVSINATWEATDWLTVRSITAYRSLDAKVGLDLDGSPYPIFGYRIDQESDQFSQELQFTGDTLGGRLNYLIGLYYFNEEAKDDSFADIYSGAAPLGFPFLSLSQESRTGLDVDSWAIFTEERFNLTDTLNLIVGGRYTSDKKDYTKNVFLTELGFDFIPYTELHDTFDAFTPKVGINWKPNDQVLLYATWSEGFKSGGWNSRDNNTDASIGNAAYEPEYVTTYEAGLKADWLDKKLRTNVAVFSSKYRDIQLSTLFLDPVTGSPAGSIENGGDARINGFEAEITAVPVAGLTLDASAGYLDDEYLELSTNAIRTGITIDDRLSNVPRWSAGAGITWEGDIGVGKLTLHADLSYRSKIYFDNLNTEQIAQPDYTLYGARIAFTPAALPRLEIAVSGTNLGDEEYLTTAYYANISGYDYGFLGRPREIVGSARYRF
jgi:iron complex outermembrane receptor protein